jgi:hypothetical protein
MRFHCPTRGTITVPALPANTQKDFYLSPNGNDEKVNRLTDADLEEHWHGERDYAIQDLFTKKWISPVKAYVKVIDKNRFAKLLKIAGCAAVGK